MRDLIDKHQYVLDSNWGDVQPDAEAENAYLERHSWDDYAAWHLGLTVGATDETKARYAFVAATCAGCTAARSSPASTGPASGATRRSSSPPTTCSSTSTPPRSGTA